MKKYTFLTAIALLTFVILLPFYARQEHIRMKTAQTDMRQQYVAEGTEVYLQNCIGCHGEGGQGIGENPALNRFGLEGADPQILFEVISRASHGTVMDTWHREEGTSLSDYQISSLVTMIQYANWDEVAQEALKLGVTPQELSTLALGEVYQSVIDPNDPHQCVACHEDPEVHLGSFGLDCARCHSLEAWTPALLTRHTFMLDHGGEGEVACEACHLNSYVAYTCYECHDHSATEMEEFHTREGYLEIENCVECHPTGEAREAEHLLNAQLSIDG